MTLKGQTRDPNTLRAQYLENYLSYRLQIWYAALYRECLAGAQIIFPESGRGLGHVTLQFSAVQSAILATAWLLVLNLSFLYVMLTYLYASPNTTRVGPTEQHTVN